MKLGMLITILRSKQAEFDFELSRCYDVYRIHHLLEKHTKTMGALRDEALSMVEELEDLDK